MSDEEFSIRINFPQYAAIMDTEETEKWVAIIIRCPLCQKEVVHQVYEKLGEKPSMESLAKFQYKMNSGRIWSREKYWEHLTTQHPEHFGEGNVAS